MQLPAGTPRFFKVHIKPPATDCELYAAPSGYVVGIRREIGSTDWLVRVLNFATYKHLAFRFADEAAARVEYFRWCL